MSDVIPIDSDVRSGYISVVLAGQNELERMIRPQLLLKDYMGLSKSSLGSIKTTSATFKPKDGESFQAFICCAPALPHRAPPCSLSAPPCSLDAPPYSLAASSKAALLPFLAPNGNLKS